MHEIFYSVDQFKNGNSKEKIFSANVIQTSICFGDDERKKNKAASTLFKLAKYAKDVRFKSVNAYKRYHWRNRRYE